MQEKKAEKQGYEREQLKFVKSNTINGKDETNVGERKEINNEREMEIEKGKKWEVSNLVQLRW
jgi:hypothetical protein